MIINLLVVILIAIMSYFFHSPGLAVFFNLIAIVSVSLGILFFLGTSVGLLRFPDFYTRMHAAGKGDTLSSILIIFGTAVYVVGAHPIHLSEFLLGLKLFLIINFIFIGSPTATHILIDAAYETEVEHWKKESKS